MKKPKQQILTRRFKVRRECYAWLNAAAIEVNQVWNWANATTIDAADRGRRASAKFLSGFDLCYLTAGAYEHFEHIGSGTIGAVCIQYANRRAQFKKSRLRWRVSMGRRHSLGWIPFKSGNIQRRGKYLRFSKKTIRIFEAGRFAELSAWGDGCFSQDAVGDWYLCLPVIAARNDPAAIMPEVGVDLGLKDIAVTSDGERLEAGRWTEAYAGRLAQAQRRGHKRQAKRIHRKISRCRVNALHKFSRSIVDRYQTIIVGDVSSVALAKTRMAKSVFDSGWGTLKTQLQYKGEYAGRCVKVVSERNTTRACSGCGVLTGPTGLDMLVVRLWTCPGCGATHDRDVNAARNILAVGLLPHPSAGTNRRKASGPKRSASIC